MVDEVTRDLDLCDSPVSPLCVRPDLHHIVPICVERKVYVLSVSRVQTARGVAPLPVQDLARNMCEAYKNLKLKHSEFWSSRR